MLRFIGPARSVIEVLVGVIDTSCTVDRLAFTIPPSHENDVLAPSIRINPDHPTICGAYAMRCEMLERKRKLGSQRGGTH
jgi:hypothetical protein